MSEDKKGVHFDPDSAKITKLAEEKAAEATAEIEEQKKDTTPTGRKSKTAKQAENVELIQGVMEPVLTGLNEVLKKKVGEEFDHEEREIKTLSVLSAKVINKHIDIDLLEHSEEVQLAAYLVMCEFTKVQAYLERRKKELREDEKNNNNGTRKTGVGENASGKKQDNPES